MTIKLGSIQNMTDEVLEIIKGVAIIRKGGGALVAVDIAIVVQKILTWMIILRHLASVRVTITAVLHLICL